MEPDAVNDPVAHPIAPPEEDDEGADIEAELPAIADDGALDIAEDIPDEALDIAEDPPAAGADVAAAVVAELGEDELGELELLFEPHAANASKLAASIVTVPTRRIRPTVPPSLSSPTIAHPNGRDPMYIEMTIGAPKMQNLAER